MKLVSTASGTEAFWKEEFGIKFAGVGEYNHEEYLLVIEKNGIMPEKFQKNNLSVIGKKQFSSIEKYFNGTRFLGKFYKK